MDENVRKILALSAQIDELMRLQARGRITKSEYNKRLSEIRRQCAFRTVEFDSQPAEHAVPSAHISRHLP
jgi:hypothetical protein